MRILRHPTTDELLHHLDGECERKREQHIEEHLRQCWKCRAQSAELQRQILAVTHSLQAENWPSAEHQSLAHRRLQALMEREEPAHPDLPSTNRRTWPLPRLVPAIPSWGWAPAVLAVAVLLIWFALPFDSPGAIDSAFAQPPYAKRTALSLSLAGWQSAARDWPVYETSRHGAVAIRIAERNAPLAVRESTVEWIAQPATGRYAARWLESSGQIRLASWHSRAPGPVSYQYRQRRWDEGREVAGPGDRSPAVFFAATSVLQTAAFEDDLFEWVQALTRQRSPLARFVDWGARPGVVVVSTTNAGATFTCMRYEDRRGSFEDCVSTNPGSAVVLEETIRIVSASHELLVRIPWSEVETGPEAIAAIASFLPPGLDLLDRDYASLLAPRPTASPSPVALAALPRAMLDAEEAVEQIRLRGGPGMILHLSSSAGLIRVSGRVSTSEQLLWVTRTLEQALPSAALQVDLQSEQDTPLPPLAESQTPTIAGQTAPRALPYVQRAFPQWSPSDLREYCNRALRLSSQIVAESAILADMAQRYPPEIESLLTLQDQERLRLLQRSRAARMAANAGVLQTHLSAIAGLAASSVPDPALDVKGRPSWQRQALAHATQAGHLHSRLLSLFAVSTEFSSDIPVARPDDGMLFSPLLRHLESLASERADSASAPSARAQ